MHGYNVIWTTVAAYCDPVEFQIFMIIRLKVKKVCNIVDLISYREGVVETSHIAKETAKYRFYFLS